MEKEQNAYSEVPGMEKEQEAYGLKRTMRPKDGEGAGGLRMEKVQEA
jgi:hypothetical protein